MLKILYQNVRGLKSKTDDFYRNVCCSQFDVIILTETWLNNGIYDKELFDPRYKVYRRDRDLITSGKSDGGGVLIAVSLVTLSHPRVIRFVSCLLLSFLPFIPLQTTLVIKTPCLIIIRII